MTSKFMATAEKGTVHMQAQPNWVVIHIAHGEAKARKIEAFLSDEGFLLRIQPISGSPGAPCFEVMTLPGEAQEARTLLMESGLL